MDCMRPTLYYARYDKCCGFPAATISNFVEVDTVLANDINIFVATTMYGLSLERATAGVVAGERWKVKGERRGDMGSGADAGSVTSD